MKTSMTTEEAIQRLFDKCATLEAANLAQVNINKLLLQAIADTHAGAKDIICAELRRFAEQNPDDLTKQVLRAMADTVVDYREASHADAPLLRLVPKQHSEDAGPDQTDD